jgi:hypothetical protein
MELTPLRAAGLFAALVFAVATIWVYRRGKIGNGDLLLRFAVFVIPLLVVSLEPRVFTWVLDRVPPCPGDTGPAGRVTMDADGLHQPSELPRLIRPILSGEPINPAPPVTRALRTGRGAYPRCSRS